MRPRLLQLHGPLRAHAIWRELAPRGALQFTALALESKFNNNPLQNCPEHQPGEWQTLQ
jgi:hypothetical protein